ncbi:hypothetical protein ACFVHB_34225 [Kitasatospora sp. NPDC127111]|uniref:hypothetical protein n=1 Tax=Kitasatospora sp. NPDC127111 TaxID=3345363 RepID=UPI003638CFF9
MTVRYIRVSPTVDLFAPVTRAFGTIAVIGKVSDAGSPPDDIAQVGVPLLFTDPAEARRRAPGDLGASIGLAFRQSPGPSTVWGVRVDATTPDYDAALDAVAALDVQLVLLANLPLDSTSGATGSAPGAVTKLVRHVDEVSGTGGDGKERMGVAMLTKGTADPSIVSGSLASDRMVYIAHQSDEDAAAAVAGTIAGYQPHVSMLLKQVQITSPPFTPSQIQTLNGTEGETSGPAGQGVNWLASPSLVGQGVYLGEGYTGNGGLGKKKFIDIVRTVDDVSFRLKAQLIKTIGNLRISRSGLRALIGQMESVLDPLQRAEVLDSYRIDIPLLRLLDKDPATLTPSEGAQINNAHAQRVVDTLVTVEYAAALHRLNIALKFQ